MKFEEILPLLRDGKKAKTNFCPPYSYWILIANHSKKTTVLCRIKLQNVFSEKVEIPCINSVFDLPELIMDETWEIIQ